MKAALPDSTARVPLCANSRAGQIRSHANWRSVCGRYSALGMLAGLPDVVRSYFELDPRDVDRFVALFSDEAIVVGETVDLRCDFAVTSDLISRLVIAP